MYRLPTKREKETLYRKYKEYLEETYGKETVSFCEDKKLAFNDALQRAIDRGTKLTGYATLTKWTIVPEEDTYYVITGTNEDYIEVTANMYTTDRLLYTLYTICTGQTTSPETVRGQLQKLIVNLPIMVMLDTATDSPYTRALIAVLRQGEKFRKYGRAALDLLQQIREIMDQLTDSYQHKRNLTISQYLYKIETTVNNTVTIDEVKKMIRDFCRCSTRTLEEIIVKAEKKIYTTPTFKKLATQLKEIECNTLNTLIQEIEKVKAPGKLREIKWTILDTLDTYLARYCKKT